MSAERAVSSREEGLHERTSHDRRRHNADGLSDLCRARLCVCVHMLYLLPTVQQCPGVRWGFTSEIVRANK